MNKNENSKEQEILINSNQDMAALLKKMKLQLDAMEEKIDSLISQSKAAGYKGKQSSRPYKEYDATKRHGPRKRVGKKEEVSSEGKFYHGRPFGQKKDTGKGGFSKGKRPFNKSSKK